MDKKALVGREYKSKVFNSMLPKKVIRVHKGVVTTSEKKYMSDENVTYPEQQFLRENFLVS
ncbi:hypothetical protein [Sulfurovum sp.]|uniref:hypothetical protein n=1 Tax=Sulfurovum sp. TaxID=1969726 RepID=UPI003566AA6B